MKSSELGATELCQSTCVGKGRHRPEHSAAERNIHQPATKKHPIARMALPDWITHSNRDRYLRRAFFRGFKGVSRGRGAGAPRNKPSVLRSSSMSAQWMP